MLCSSFTELYPMKLCTGFYIKNKTFNQIIMTHSLIIKSFQYGGILPLKNMLSSPILKTCSYHANNFHLVYVGELFHHACLQFSCPYHRQLYIIPLQ